MPTDVSARAGTVPVRRAIHRRRGLGVLGAAVTGPRARATRIRRRERRAVEPPA